ncbi:MAG: DMT family transporter [Candidatus Riflebacteria bacterium]|nr:DMT family transporter [Candidatus Riflebacteria bacterium]
MKKHTLGVILVLVAAFLWSFSGVAVKRLPGLDSISISGYRSVFTIPVLLISMIVFSGGLKGIFKLSAAAFIRPVVWSSAACYAGTLILFISATKYTTAANAIFLQYTAPVYAAILSWPITREKVQYRDWIALSVCLAGMAFFFRDGLTTEGLKGNVLGILSGITWALNAIFLRIMNKKVSQEETAQDESSEDKSGLSLTLPAVLLGNFLVVVLCLPGMSNSVFPEKRELLILAMMGIFQIGIPYILFIVGIAWVTAVEGIIIATLEAILNPIWAALGANEIPSPSAIAGGLIILVSVTFYGISSPSKEK